VAPRSRVWFAHAIRGPACLLVVFAHLFDLFPSSQAVVAPLAGFPPVAGLPSVPWAGVLRWLGRYGIEPGAIGVLLFFLVSGFVIPFSLERVDRRGFVVRRFFRLYPTLWVCLLVTLAVLAVQARALGTVVPYRGRALAANAFLIGPYTRLPWVEPVLWSLAVEELFDVVAGAVAWRGLLLSRLAMVAVAAGLVAVCVATRGAALASPLFWLGFNATYVVFILIGVVFHCVYRGLWGLRAGAASVVGLFGLYVLALHNGPARPVASIYVPSAVVALVVFCCLYWARDRLPYSVWLDRLSNVSYPLYLLHGINGYVITRAMFTVTGNYYLAVSVAVVASLSLAAAVHHLVENPTNNLGRRLSRRLGRAADAPVVVATSRSVSPSPLPS
jgi:peptidoglycan/LPS O-acetylase OafA/YrhL